MPRSIALFLVLALALPSAAARAQAPVQVRAGSAVVDASRLESRTDTFVATRADRTMGLEIRTAVEPAAVLRVERMFAMNGVTMHVDSFQAARPSLVPEWTEMRSITGDRTSLRFHGTEVTGSQVKSGAALAVSLHADPPSFYANSTDLVLASLPLAEGRRFTVSMVDLERGRYDLELTVAGIDRLIAADGGTCDAWRIEATGEAEPSTYWVERRSQTLLGYRAGEWRLRIVHHPACLRSAVETAER